MVTYNWNFIFLEEKIFQYPNISETAFTLNLFGLHLNVQWYGLSYIAGILLAWFFMAKLVQNKDLWFANKSIIERSEVDDLITYMILGIIAGSVERVATEIRHLQRSEVYELQEFFSKDQKGSSAMPHKKNPILSENLTGLARMVRSYVVPALENIALWHERDISHSSVERNIGPDANITLDFALVRLASILDKMIVYPKKMLENLNFTKGLVFSQELMLELTKSGMQREKAYRLVQGYAKSSFAKNINLIDLVKNDKKITERISETKIKKIFTYFKHFKNVNYIFKRVLK